MVVFGDSLALIWQARAAQISALLGQLALVEPSEHVERRLRFGLDAPLVGAAELAFTGPAGRPREHAP